MSHPVVTWPLIPTGPAAPAPVPPTLPTPSAVSGTSVSPLGLGLIRPMRRNGRGDFDHTDGPRLVEAAIGQILGTVASSDFTQGEIPWRPEFGSLLYLLKHQPNTPALDELARTYVVDALATWEPRARVSEVFVGRNPREEGGESTLVIKVKFGFVDRASGSVVLPDLETTITI